MRPLTSLVPIVSSLIGFAIVAVACGEEQAAPETPPLTSGGAGGTSASSSVASNASSSAVSVSVSSGSGGAFACDPPAAPGSLYELEDVDVFDLSTQSMCRYRGDVVFMFNAAAL